METLIKENAPAPYTGVGPGSNKSTTKAKNEVKTSPLAFIISIFSRKKYNPLEQTLTPQE